MTKKRCKCHKGQTISELPAYLSDTCKVLAHFVYFTSPVTRQTIKTLLRTLCQGLHADHFMFAFILWLAPQAGKVNRIVLGDWLPVRARWCCYLAHSGLPAMSPPKNLAKSHTLNPLLTKLTRLRWLDIGLVLFFESLWTSTPSQSMNT